jgi:hypothetical protein
MNNLLSDNGFGNNEFNINFDVDSNLNLEEYDNPVNQFLNNNNNNSNNYDLKSTEINVCLNQQDTNSINLARLDVNSNEFNSIDQPQLSSIIQETSLSSNALTKTASPSKKKSNHLSTASGRKRKQPEETNDSTNETKKKAAKTSYQRRNIKY